MHQVICIRTYDTSTGLRFTINTRSVVFRASHLPMAFSMAFVESPSLAPPCIYRAVRRHQHRNVGTILTWQQHSASKNNKGWRRGYHVRSPTCILFERIYAYTTRIYRGRGYHLSSPTCILFERIYTRIRLRISYECPNTDQRNIFVASIFFSNRQLGDTGTINTSYCCFLLLGLDETHTAVCRALGWQIHCCYA